MVGFLVTNEGPRFALQQTYVRQKIKFYCKQMF